MRSPQIAHVGTSDNRGRVSSVRLHRGPGYIAQAVLQHAGAKASVGIETCPMMPWLVHELRLRGLDVICVDARHARAALRMQLNKTDRNDAEGLAQIMRTGWYRAVHAKSLAARASRAGSVAAKVYVIGKPISQ